MKFGGLWGGLWGGPSTPAETCERSQLRALMQIRRGTNTRGLLCVLGTIYGQLKEAQQQVKNGYSFDYAVGVQLDAIGALLRFPRTGQSDVQYLLDLKTWAKCITSDTTEETLLDIVRGYVGIAPTLTFVDVFPMGFRIEISVLDLALLPRLLVFVRAAKAAAYGFALAVSSDTSALLGDLVGGGVANAHNCDAIGVAVADPGTCAVLFT